MVEDGVYHIKDGVGYDVYFNGRYVGWARTQEEGRKIYRNWEEAEVRKRQKQEAEARKIEHATETGVKGENMAKQQQQGGAQQNQPQATADQNRFTNVVANLVVPKSKTSWVLIIVLLISLIVASWYTNFLGFRTILLNFGVTISGIIAVIVIIIFIAYGWATSKDNIANFYIATALFIWFLDLVPQNFFLIGPWLGPEWAGFVFPLDGIWKISWASIFLSGFFFSLLYINMVFNIIEKEYMGFGFGFLFILVTNYFFNFLANSYPILSLGFNIYIPSTYTILYNIGVISLLALLGWGAWHLDKNRKGAVPEFFSYVYMIFVFSFFWTTNVWETNLRAVFHAIFILAFGFGYIKTRPNTSPTTWHIFIPSLLIADFFGYGFLWNSDIPILRFIPIIVLFVIFYCYEKETQYGKRNYTYPVFALILLITFILIMTLKVSGIEEGTIPFVAQQGTTFSELYTQFTNNIKNVVENKLDYATGGLYRGSVEKNQYESLGVYFSNIRASEPKFYSDEPVIVWGSIRSKTYQDPVIVNFKCSRWKGTDNKNRIESTTKQPPNPFLVFQLEQNDVECTFSEKTLDVGYNTVTFSAEYNFATNGYKKAYFMDKDRYRSLVKENIDPFKEFSIQDTQPKPVYTNGPVEIGIDVQALTPVSDSYVVYPTLGISLLNRQQIEDKDKKIITKWDGRIKNITELVVLMPPTVEIPNIDKCDKENFAKGECPCNRPFKSYGVEDCRKSCDLQVWNPCQRACEFYEDATSKDRCRNDCSSTLQNCNNECNNLFGIGEGEGTGNEYRGYSLDVENLQYKNEYSDIDSDRHRTFVCRIKPTTQVLDNTPITTRYFRVRARYNYLLENSVKVNVEQAPTSFQIVTNVPEFYSQIPEATYQGIYYNANSDNEKKYSGLVFKYAKENNVEYLFVKAIIQKESGWNPSAKGDGGNSLGLMQMSQGTAASLGCDTSKLFDPEENVKCGVGYLRSIITGQTDKSVSSDLRNIAAAYNCGIALKPDAVYGLLWKNPNNCWDKAHTTNTIIYVGKVMEYYNKMRNQLEVAQANPGGDVSAP